MKVFIYEGLNPNLKESCEVANAIWDKVLFHLRMNEVPIVNGYNKPVHTSSLLAEMMEMHVTTLTIKEYYYRSSNVLGMYDARHPTTIFINTRSLPRQKTSLVSTFYHELVHYIDTQTTLDFSHGFGWTRNRWMRWKEKSGPFYVDNVAETVAKNYLGISQTSSRSNNTLIKTRPLWHRILFFWK
jgi:hypothetical protein